MPCAFVCWQGENVLNAITADLGKQYYAGRNYTKLIRKLTLHIDICPGVSILHLNEYGSIIIDLQGLDY